jgi:hypothetical protein
MLQIQQEDERSVMAVARNVAFVGWRGTPTAAGVRTWQRLAQRLAAKHPGGTACFDIVVAGTPNMSDDVRRAATDLAGDPNLFTLGVAHVLLMPGLAGTAVRAFISTILLIARAPAPQKVFAATEPAAAWLAPRLEDWTVRELERGCAELVDRLLF